MHKDSIARWGSLIAIVIALGSIWFAQSSGILPGASGTRYPDGIAASGVSIPSSVAITSNKLKISSTGVAISSYAFGQCDLNFGTAPVSFAASTTKTVDCQATNMLASATAVQAALTGVAAWSATAQDIVAVTLASSTPSTYLGLGITGCSASSTAGYITCQVTNETGGAFTPATTTTHWATYRSTRL